MVCASHLGLAIGTTGKLVQQRTLATWVGMRLSSGWAVLGLAYWHILSFQPTSFTAWAFGLLNGSPFLRHCACARFQMHARGRDGFGYVTHWLHLASASPDLKPYIMESDFFFSLYTGMGLHLWSLTGSDVTVYGDTHIVLDNWGTSWIYSIISVCF